MYNRQLHSTSLTWADMMMNILLAVLAIAMIVTEAKPRFSQKGDPVEVHTTDYPVGDLDYAYKGLVCVETGLYDKVRQF